MQWKSHPALIFLLFISHSVYSIEPWFSGPLIANSGTTAERNHLELDFYQYYFMNEGKYLPHNLPIRNDEQISDVSLFMADVGITDFLDLQIYSTYNHNVSQNSHSNRIGDSNILSGLQVMRQENSVYRPNIRLSIEQTVPTGKYDELNPVENGTDSTGLGSNQTNFGVNLDHLCEPLLGHFLRTTLNLNYLYAPPTEVARRNAYGGTSETLGTVKPGHLKSIDLALELTLSQHWGIGIETYLSKRGAEKFSGQIGRHENGEPGSIGNGVASTDYSIAPLLEYNVNENFGVLAAYWCSIGGSFGGRFRSPVIGIVYTLG